MLQRLIASRKNIPIPRPAIERNEAPLLTRLLRARLSWRIAFWVLVSILVIETIIVFPSYRVRKSELLTQLEDVGANTILPIINMAAAQGEGGDLIPLAEKLTRETVILGGAFYLPGGQPLGVFGEPPAISYSGMHEMDPTHVLTADGSRYDVAWDHKQLGTRYALVVRLDATHVSEELIAYTWRMIGFILLISAFVTTAAMFAVGITTITPILKLRENLLATGQRTAYEQVHILPRNRPDELGDVMGAFHTMAHRIEQRTTQLETSNARLTALNERLQHELTMAQKIQRSLLPPATPTWNSPTLRCYTTPMSAVGGDFYVYHNHINGTYGVAVGDVSGKGMPAALLMAVSVASFHSIVQHEVEPETLLAQLDQSIAFYTRTTRLNCALIYALLHAQEPDGNGNATYTMCVANAGCIQPIIRRREGALEWVNVSGMPLGIGMGARSGYQKMGLTLTQGDMVILTSDGVVEAKNGARQMFGFARLEQTIAEGPVNDADAMLAHIKQQVHVFVQDEEAHDDLTIVVVQV
jgi:serine phosphatase RsbU (regulator of sigma subunit)